MAEMSLGGVLLTALNCAPLIEYADCGENIRHNSQNREIYHIIKDARGMARSAERTVIPGEILKPSSHWETVHNLGWQIITSASLDIEILAWLIEAELRLGGFRGLRTMYEKLTVIVTQHWDALRSVDDDDEAERFSPFAGLNGLGAEGALVQPLRLASLLPAGKFGEMSLWDFQLGQRPGEAARREKLQQAASEAGRQAMSAHLCDVTGALVAFDAMMAVISEKGGAYAPPSSNIRSVLIEAATAMRALGAVDLAEPVAPDEPMVAPVNGAHAAVPSARPATAGPEGIASREQAFELLADIARYFRRTEPHSPIPMAIETLVRRGRMDFLELLAELVPEAQARNAVLTAAGIKPDGDGITKL